MAIDQYAIMTSATIPYNCNTYARDSETSNFTIHAHLNRSKRLSMLCRNMIMDRDIIIAGMIKTDLGGRIEFRMSSV